MTAARREQRDKDLGTRETVLYSQKKIRASLASLEIALAKAEVDGAIEDPTPEIRAAAKKLRAVYMRLDDLGAAVERDLQEGAPLAPATLGVTSRGGEA